MSDYPDFEAPPPVAITCPNCGAFSQHHWGDLGYFRDGEDWADVQRWRVAECISCDQPSFWFGDRLMYPESMMSIQPHADMPAPLRDDFTEAQAIARRSPRGAAALLRLCIQRLCKELGKPGRNIDDDIAALVADGLDDRMQMSLDAVRVIGNSAVHPGALDVNDRPQDVEALFKIVNEIVEELIGRPKRLDALYGSLPESSRTAIDKRNAKARKQ